MKIYKSASEVKQALLNLEEVVIGKWSAMINENDELEMWAPNGEGRSASFSYFDKAVNDFCKWAGIPDKMPKPVSFDNIPKGSGPLGNDTADDKPWTDPKVNSQPVMQGDGADESLGKDTSADKPWSDPSVDKRPDEKAKDNGSSDPELGSDTTRNPTEWDSKLRGVRDAAVSPNSNFFLLKIMQLKVILILRLIQILTKFKILVK